MHGRVSVLVLHVDVGALGHQQLHQFGVALRHRQLQRRLVPVVADVDVAASLWRRSKGGQNCNVLSNVLKRFCVHSTRENRQLTSLTRISATSRWLFREARCSAEKPSSFLTSTSCRARARIFSVALPPGQTTQDSIRQRAQHCSRLKLGTVKSAIAAPLLLRI